MSKPKGKTTAKRIPWNKDKGKGWIGARGYRWIYVAEDGKRRAKKYARCLMEKHLSRRLEPWELVHHIDKNPKNDVLDNLEVMTFAEHIMFHKPGSKITARSKNIMAVMAQMREEVLHLRKIRDKYKSLNSDLLAACENALPLIAGERIAFDAFPPTDVLTKALAKDMKKSEQELIAAIAKTQPITGKKEG